MLGARREHVIERVRKLDRDGAIKYSRGRIQLLDREQLEKRTCECYAVVKNEYALAAFQQNGDVRSFRAPAATRAAQLCSGFGLIVLGARKLGGVVPHFTSATVSDTLRHFETYHPSG